MHLLQLLHVLFYFACYDYLPTQRARPPGIIQCQQMLRHSLALMRSGLDMIITNPIILISSLYHKQICPWARFPLKIILMSVWCWGNATEVLFHVTVMSLDTIDESSMTYTCDIFFAQSWHDYRYQLASYHHNTIYLYHTQTAITNSLIQEQQSTTFNLKANVRVA